MATGVINMVGQVPTTIIIPTGIIFPVVAEI
jgi:hypothetical protein